MTANYSHYSIPTANRFDILSNYQNIQLNDPGCLSDLDCPPRSPPKTKNIQYRSFYRKKVPRRNTTTTPSLYPLDNLNLQKAVKNEDSISFIPTIVKGVKSVANNQETVRETSGVNSAKINSVITNVREFINTYHNRNHSPMKHRIILIGDSNIRGYANSLEPLLKSNYNLYSVVKPGSGSNELEKSAIEEIRQLNHDDIIILYGTNDLDLKNSMNPKGKFSCTFQNIKNFIMKYNHTNILLINMLFHMIYPIHPTLLTYLLHGAESLRS
jgi:hypothetical protein